MIIPAGHTVVLDVKGDLKSLNGNNLPAGTSTQISLSGVSNNAQGSYSSQLSTVPNSAVLGPTLTIVGAGLTLAVNAGYSDQTLTANTTGFLIGSYTLSANSSEPINVTGLTVGISGTFPLTSIANLYTSVNLTKQNPQATNNVSANFTIPANGSQVVNVYADIGSLSNGATTTSLQTTLQVTANGATSNAVASSNSLSGQTLTVGTGTLNTPTLTSNTPVSQLVIGGTNGSGIMNLGFTATIGAAVITELDFTSTSSAITSITVGGVTQSFAGITATTSVSGLNISIPVQNANVEVPVTVAYATVGNNGIASNATTTLLLTHVKYTSGNASKDLYPVISSNAVYPVAGYPNISIVSQSSNSLTSGSNQIAQVTVQAVGPITSVINLRSLPLVISSVVTATTSGLTMEVNGTNTTIATSTFTGTNGTATLTFTNGGYQIQGGSTVTFDVFANVGAITNTGNGDSLSTQLGAASLVVWDDVNGGATGLDASLIPNYSTANKSTLAN